MTVVRRCLVQSHEPQRIVKAVKELVARDLEIIAAIRTAGVLRENGIPVTGISSFASSTTGFGQDFELLHPSVQGGVLGRWDDAEQKEELERLGIKKIDLVLVELPEGVHLKDASRADMESMGAVALLRSAASNPEIVITLCEPGDLAEVLSALDQNESLSQRIRRELSVKALQAVASFDAALACAVEEDGQSPATWSVFAKRIPEVPLRQPGSAAGLYRVSGTEDLAELKCVSGPALDAVAMMDLDLADAILSGVESSAVTIVHHGTPCGFAMVDSQGEARAFELARSSDPRGAFGAIAGFNREIDGACARSLAEAYLQAVLAPDFSPEARAELSSRKITVLKAVGGAKPSPSIRSTRWGLSVNWGDTVPRSASDEGLVAGDPPIDDEKNRGMDIAWNLAVNLPAVALVVCDEHHMLSCVSGQTSWREALRLAMLKLPAGVDGAVAASAQAIRFADEVMTLANAGVRAIRCVTGSPRQSEVLSKARQLGVSLELVKLRE